MRALTILPVAALVASCGGNVEDAAPGSGTGGAASAGTNATGGYTSAGSSAPNGLIPIEDRIWDQLVNSNPCIGNFEALPVPTRAQSSYCGFEVFDSTTAYTDGGAATPDGGIFGAACTLGLPPLPNGTVRNPTMLNFIYQSGAGAPLGYLVTPTVQSDCTNGGWYANVNANEVVLCASTCAAICADRSGFIRGIQGCYTNFIY